MQHQHAAGSGDVSLDVYASDNTVDLLTARSAEGKIQLWHQRSGDGGENWSVPARVDLTESPPFSPHRGNDPQIAAVGDRILAAWTTAGDDAWGSGPIATALSLDGGKTWSAGANPADDGLLGGHGFMDLAADAAGKFHLVWLDSRDGQQGLRYARSADGKQWTVNRTLKAVTCECCPNSFAVSADRLAVLYRSRDPRDMHVMVSPNAGLTWPVDASAADFGWQFNGCPHSGGGIAFANGNLHALVWTGQTSNVGVHYVASDDGGLTWAKPRRLGEVDASHPDLASDGKRLAAAWESGGGIWAAIASGEGKWAQPRLLSKIGSWPRVIHTGTGFRAFWTEEAEDKKQIWRSRLVEAP